MTAERRVLLIANNFPPIRGGSAVVYGNLARCADGRVIVLAPRNNYVDGLPISGWREHDQNAGYRVVRLSLLRTVIDDRPGRRASRLLFRISDAIIRLRVTCAVLSMVMFEQVRTICVGELQASSWIIRMCRYLPGVQTVVYVHGEEITTDDPYDPAHVRARRALLGCDHIIVVSDFTLHAVNTLLGHEAPETISLISNGVNTRTFRPRPKSSELLDLYQIRGCFVFVSVCRLLEKKGIDNAIRAFAVHARGSADSRYLVVGAGPFQDALQSLALSENVADRVIFTGQVDDDELVDHYQLGDVFVMPNRELPNGDTEGFGLVFLEANACGLPVIAGRDGGSTAAIRDGCNGLIVDGRSVESIRGAMQCLYDDPVLRERLSQGAIRISAEADWEGKAKMFLQICVGGNTRDSASPGMTSTRSGSAESP